MWALKGKLTWVSSWGDSVPRGQWDVWGRPWLSRLGALLERSRWGPGALLSPHSTQDTPRECPCPSVGDAEWRDPGPSRELQKQSSRIERAYNCDPWGTRWNGSWGGGPLNQNDPCSLLLSGCVCFWTNLLNLLVSEPSSFFVFSSLLTTRTFLSPPEILS